MVQSHITSRHFFIQMLLVGLVFCYCLFFCVFLITRYFLTLRGLSLAMSVSEWQYHGIFSTDCQTIFYVILTEEIAVHELCVYSLGDSHTCIQVFSYTCIQGVCTSWVHHIYCKFAGHHCNTCLGSLKVLLGNSNLISFSLHLPWALHPDHQHGLWGEMSVIQHTVCFIEDHAWASLTTVQFSDSIWERFLVREKREICLATSAIPTVAIFCVGK